MKKEIKNTIESRLSEVNDNRVTSLIIKRVVSKFFDDAENDIVIFSAKDYLISLMKQKKQDLFYHLMPCLLEVSNRLNQDFDMLFENPENYRDAHYQII